MEQKQIPPSPVVEIPAEVLAELITNQQLLAENQASMLRAQRTRSVWGILKFLWLIGMLIAGWWYSQEMISSLFGKKTSPFEQSAVEMIGGELETLKRDVESRPFGVDQEILEEMGLGQ